MSNVLEVSDASRLSKEPLVTVVMLAYRHERCLAEAIESVLMQRTDFEFELIIGEDCSPDGTREIALDYQRRFPEVIRVRYGESNVGGNLNSRRTVAAARGRYIAFCEGDDYWTRDDKLQRQVDLFRAEPTTNLVHTDFDRRIGDLVEHDVRRNKGSPIAAGAEALAVLLEANAVVTATSMYRASALDGLASSDLADAAWPFGDYPKALFAALTGHVAYWPEASAVYRQFPGSATNQGRQARLRMYEAALECRERFLALSNLEPALKRAILAASLRRLRRVALAAGNERSFNQHVASLKALGEGTSRLLIWAGWMLFSTLR